MLAPAFIILTEIVLPDRRRLLKLQVPAIAAFAGYAAALAGYLVLRSKAVLMSVSSPEFGDLTPYQRILTALRICMEYVGLLLYPGTLAADYPRADLHIANNPAEPGVFLAMALLGMAVVAMVWFWKRQPLVSWGLLFFMMSLFPVSNLPFAIYVMKAERLLYTPSAGFLLALVALIHYGLEQRRADTLFWPVVGVVTVLFFMRSTARNEDWRNNFTLASATLKTSPTSQRMKTLIFNWYRDHGQNDLARQYLSAAYGDASRNDGGAMYNLANLELDSRNYAEAIRLYRRILELEPNNANAMNNLGQALDEAGRLEEAVKVYENLLHLQPNSPGPYVNLVHVLLRLKNAQRALPIAETAMSKFPRNEGVWWNAGAVYQELGRTEDAQAAFKRAQQIDANISKKQTLKLEY
jgi:Flp pilus assembly protein TadD